MRESLREKIKEVEGLLLNPFDPYSLENTLQELLKEMQNITEDEARELSAWLNTLYKRLEENYRIALGWLEELSKMEGGGFKA